MVVNFLHSWFAWFRTSKVAMCKYGKFDNITQIILNVLLGISGNIEPDIFDLVLRW